ncbi:MAG: rhomboid family intramembrane serine protease [Thermoplasmatales archaeon]|nr:MAG: rhomboid family intramembrane serine protease [Thermoplasmatales archaeon]
MEVVINQISLISLIAIFVIIGAILVTYIKKWMLTYMFIVANIIIFILTKLSQVDSSFVTSSPIVADLAFKPFYLSIEQFPQLYTLFTSMFLHGGFAHIFGNMFIFFFLGLAFERRIGWKKFLIIYLLSGICGTLTHSLLNIGSTIPLIGASGAIFGIMGAFAYSYPRDEVVMPIPLGVIMLIRRVKVIYAVLLFAAIETVIVWWESRTGMQDSTAHFAHLGGLVGGIILAALIIRNIKTHKKSGETIYHDSYSSFKPKNINFSNLRELADTQKLKDMLEKIENETVPQVKDIWLENFIEKAKCPKCKNRLSHLDGSIWCEHCNFKTKY